MRQIFIVGYPRSGNTWLARMIGEAIDCDVGSVKAKGSLASRDGRNNNYRVAQTHFNVASTGPLIQCAKYMNPSEKGHHAIVYVYRDPRDVSISACHYWRRKSIKDTLLLMESGSFPMSYGPWSEFITNWISNRKHIDYITRYEDMHSDAINVLRDCLEALRILPTRPLDKVVEECSFSSMRKRVRSKEGEFMSYGRDIQLHHLRKGHVADWKNYYDREIGKLAHKIFWPILNDLGYEKDENWWLKLPPKTN